MRYRESSSSTYPPWSFPCRCTDGCNTDTGDCLNGGTCIPDIPVGYTWSGQACRYGEIYMCLCIYGCVLNSRITINDN